MAIVNWQEVPYGIRWHTQGFLDIETAQEWFATYMSKRNEFVKQGRQWSQYVDLRGYKASSPEAQELITKVMEAFLTSGGLRSAVILDSTVATLQIKRLAIDTGIYAFERYISAQSNPDFEKQALAWLVDGIDPDKK